MSDDPYLKILNGLIAIVLGVGGTAALYWLLNFLSGLLPGKWDRRVKPYVFIGPAILVVTVFLVYPAVMTVIYSFADDNSINWVGFGNYTALFRDDEFIGTLVNNLLWILIVPAASEIQIFFKVVVPQIWPTVIVVFVTILILVMKVFDIVYVMTGGRSGTSVLANTFVLELFEFGDAGRAAAVVVVLMIAVIPVMVYQMRQFKKQEAR